MRRIIKKKSYKKHFVPPPDLTQAGGAVGRRRRRRARAVSAFPTSHLHWLPMAHLLATVALATDTFVSQTGHQMAYNLSVTNGAGPTMAIVTSLKDSAGRFHCLDLYGENPANGTRVDVWTCVSPPIPGQMWFFDTNSYAIRSLVDPKMCVDTGNMTVGTQLSISPCVKAKDSQRIGWNESGSLYLVPPQKKPPLGLCFEPKHDASGNVTNGSWRRPEPARASSLSFERPTSYQTPSSLIRTSPPTACLLAPHLGRIRRGAPELLRSAQAEGRAGVACQPAARSCGSESDVHVPCGVGSLAN